MSFISGIGIAGSISFDLIKENQERDLFNACQAGNLDGVKSLIGDNVDIEAKNQNGDTPLLVACMEEKWDVVKFLIEKGANVEAKNFLEFKTPLMMACCEGRLEIAESLILHHVRFDAKDALGETALHYALTHENLSLIKLILPHMTDANPKNYEQNTPLHIACQNGFESLIPTLLERAEHNMSNSLGYTPLHEASAIGHIRIINLLIAYGENLDSQGDDGCTPLHLALHLEEMEAADLLIASGARTDIKNKYGEDVEQLAADLDDQDFDLD